MGSDLTSRPLDVSPDVWAMRQKFTESIWKAAFPAGLLGCFSEFFSDDSSKSVGRDGQSLNPAHGERIIPLQRLLPPGNVRVPSAARQQP